MPEIRYVCVVCREWYSHMADAIKCEDTETWLPPAALIYGQVNDDVPMVWVVSEADIDGHYPHVVTWGFRDFQDGPRDNIGASHCMGETDRVRLKQMVPNPEWACYKRAVAYLESLCIAPVSVENI